MLLYIAVTCCSMAVIFLIIIHIVRHSKRKIIPIIKISIAPFAILGTVAAFFVIQNIWIAIVVILIALMTIIFTREGYVHYLLLKKGYPIPNKEEWFLMPIKEVKKLPDMAPGFEEEAKDFLSRKIFFHT